MAPNASEIMGSLYGVIDKTYGPEVAKFVNLNLRGGASLTDEGDLETAAFNIKLDDDDWFEGGSASFVMTGVFKDPAKLAEKDQEKEREEERRLIIANDKTEQLMETLSVVTTFTSATDATALLNGNNGGGDHGYREGNQEQNMGKGGEAANKAEEKDDDPSKDKSTSESNIEGESEKPEGDEKKGEAEKEATPTENRSGDNTASEQDSKEEGDTLNKGQNQPPQVGTQEANNTNKGTSTTAGGATKATTKGGRKKGDKKDRRNPTGRGREGGRGRGRHNDERRNQGTSKPTLVSPGPVVRKGILKNGNPGGSGPGAPAGAERESEKEWNLVGTKKDSVNLLKKFEGGGDSTGAAGGGNNP